MRQLNAIAKAMKAMGRPADADGAADGAASAQAAEIAQEPAALPIKHVRRHQPRPVVDPQGRVWPSISAAALAHDMLPSSLWPLVHLGRHGWRLARPDEIER